MTNTINKADKKYCPRCEQEFYCHAKQIEHCPCSDLELSELHLSYIAQQYTDCLCLSCLKVLKLEYDQLSSG